MKLSIVNIYAPNVANDRKNFLKLLNTKVKEISNGEYNDLILCGDFNCAQDPKLDRRNEHGLNPNQPDSGHVEIKSIVQENDLEDV